MARACNCRLVPACFTRGWEALGGEWDAVEAVPLRVRWCRPTASGTLTAADDAASSSPRSPWTAKITLMTTEPNIVLFTGVAVLVALTTSCASPVAKTGPAPAAVIGEAAEGGNAPVAMPVRPPHGYEFGGSVGVNHRRGEPVATAWMFESVAESNAVPVVVCVRGMDTSAETCPAGNPRTGYERATSRYLVSVSSGDSARPELPEEWEVVRFTEEWRDLSWVPAAPRA